jgi:hypothetical protein
LPKSGGLRFACARERDGIGRGSLMAGHRGVTRAALLLAAIVIVATFVWLFRVRSSDQSLAPSPAAFAKLDELRNEPKYVEVFAIGYSGLRPEPARQMAEAQLNDLIDRVHDVLAATPTKAFVLREFAVALARFEPTDSEDRDRLCRYLEQIMDIAGIQSSDGMINRWRYGLILGTILEFSLRSR